MDKHDKHHKPGKSKGKGKTPPVATARPDAPASSVDPTIAAPKDGQRAGGKKNR